MSGPLVIPARFNGPPGSGNGGFSAGRFAARLVPGRPVEITLRRPVPLDTDLVISAAESDAEGDIGADTEGEIRADTAAVTAADRPDELIASLRVVDEGELGGPVPPVPFADAVVAALQFPGRTRHPFPTCFVCGPERPDRDGLEVFAGPVGGVRTYTAAALVLRPEHLIDGEVAPELVWAALDCPGGWSIDLPARPAVLGRVAGVVRDLPAVGEHCVIVATLDGRQGRKAFTRTTAYGADGRELGRTSATWIELVPPG